MKIVPSIYCANLIDLKTEITNLTKAQINQIHFDVMDGVFVKNYALSNKLVDEIKQHFPNLIIEVHIMGIDLLDKISLFKNADYLTFHYNAINDLNQAKLLIKEIRKHNLKPGIALDLNNEINDIQKILNEIELVTFMSIKPGFTGQKFEDSTWNKLNLIKELKVKYPHLKFQIDGGVRWENIKKLINCQLDWIVVGSLLFNEDNYLKVVNKIKQL
ncbi:ribulose-phosphate 3-epimerase [Mycoplasma capricolum]|uniref:Ribulose-phosphate 3-epimerase n=2 Tax=Mycoplasma capricolum subsp. capricolum TaxID=40479 RepID=A0A0C2ZMI2_MYCCA|nr:ribulose-phosphate 3-epimerase [Mycoplasma capricolum]ABC01438.1 ribulose-phosphate 3-epimerase, putative [Mycoplasma capricolum subsp. capricolum ATCC 27343]KIM14080.1 ribulose-phosphate 3-epimerase [Mycoplasma capricolum subsp. capricolum]